MEIRAPYAVVGALVLSAIVAIFGFVYWLDNSGGIGKRDTYQLVFNEPVPGLLVGAAVLFNGIRVGEVTSLGLAAGDPRGVHATVAVDENTPVRANTKVGLDFQGLTGVPVVALEGGDSAAAAPVDGPLVAEKGAGQSMTQAARDALRKVDDVLSDNATPLHDTIGNLSTFAAGLARNTPKLDGILAGLERMTGGGAQPARKLVYDLQPTTTFDTPNRKLDGSFIMADPTAVARLQTQRFLFSPDQEVNGFDGAQWSDSLPVLLQARLSQSFENFDIAHAPLRGDSGVESAPRLLIDLRQFEIATSPSPRAVIAFSAKLVDAAGHLRGARIFEQSAPFDAMSPPQAAAAFNKSFDVLARELISWMVATS
jgi:phospholipid/cholesterol/gamma-HCH transport system substrate-binding protein